MGVGFDGASNMSGCYSGAQAEIRKKYPHVIYTHCALHSLNLALCKTSRVGLVGLTFATIQQIISFLLSSPKRTNRFVEVVAVVCPDSPVRKLVKLCGTRWVECHDCILVFMSLYCAIISVLEEIVGSIQCDTEVISKANALVSAATEFSFMFTMAMLEFVSAIMLSVSKAL